MKGKVSKVTVEKLKAGEILADDKLDGFVARRLPSGKVSYGYRYRNREGVQRWVGLGLHGKITADQARELAKKRQGEVAAERDPAAEVEIARTEAKREARAEANTVNAILDTFVARHVKNLRSGAEVERCFNVYVRPRIGAKSIYDLSRRDVVEMLDKIEDGNGPVMADRVLAHVRKAFNWHATRDDQFSPPIVRGMARTKPSERARDRVLADQELRDLFAALDSAELPEAFRRLVPALLFTAQRRANVLAMHHDEIEGGNWTIPKAKYKTKTDLVVPLTDKAREYIGEGAGFVFAGRDGRKPFNGMSKSKVALDAEINRLRKKAGQKAMPHWTFHDLRRTARTLMSRAGVDKDIAERVIGHVIPGVRGVYDRFEYLPQKRDALERLAAMVDRILDPPAGNVVELRR